MRKRKYKVHSYLKEHLVVGGNIHGYTCKTNHKENAELIAKILNDDENGVSSVVKAWEQYRGVDVI